MEKIMERFINNNNKSKAIEFTPINDVNIMEDAYKYWCKFIQIISNYNPGDRSDVFDGHSHSVIFLSNLTDVLAEYIQVSFEFSSGCSFSIPRSNDIAKLIFNKSHAARYLVKMEGLPARIRETCSTGKCDLTAAELMEISNAMYNEIESTMRIPNNTLRFMSHERIEQVRMSYYYRETDEYDPYKLYRDFFIRINNAKHLGNPREVLDHLSRYFFNNDTQPGPVLKYTKCYSYIAREFLNNTLREMMDSDNSDYEAALATMRGVVDGTINAEELKDYDLENTLSVIYKAAEDKLKTVPGAIRFSRNMQSTMYNDVLGVGI